MAKVAELDMVAFNAWVETRPPVVQALCERLPPDRLYRLKSSGHRVTLRSYCEDGTVTVNVTGQYNALAFDRYVFGIAPADLEECAVLRGLLSDLRSSDARTPSTSVEALPALAERASVGAG